jgi:hypothetical protein
METPDVKVATYEELFDDFRWMTDRYLQLREEHDALLAYCEELELKLEAFTREERVG